MKLTYLPDGYQSYTDRSDDYVRFVLENQLLNETLWQKFVNVFVTREDAVDDGWRGEYFGKMMRGACLTYRYSPNEKLYALLKKTVRALIATADKEGRISTYPVSHEFCGWDLWCRKYVLVGCLYFYGICKDAELKETILAAMKRHLDYIEARIGKNGIAITDTSVWYGGMNSSSILEPVVELYKLTKEPRYLAFAEYIIHEGGCKQGSVVEAVKAGTLPHEFPTTKAYETTSFFEGILAYYEVTGENKWLFLVEKFADLVAENEITLIGCAGCHGEHFDHAAVTQANDIKEKTIMQETCVTVTWLRLQERLLRATGEAKYADRMEVSALNALYGALNLHNEKQFCKEEKSFLPGVPFDSYSPLVAARRGVGIGGFKRFSEGGYYGCCACIGAAGVALYPFASTMLTKDGAEVVFYHSGKIKLPFEEGEMLLDAQGTLSSGRMEYVVSAAPSKEKTIAFRIPSWSESTEVYLNGEEVKFEGSILSLCRPWQAGDKVTLVFGLSVKAHRLNGKAAFTYGPFALARDEKKDKRFGKPLRLEKELVSFAIQKEEGEEVRLLLHTKKGEVLLTDYASCGKHWTEKKSHIAVWSKEK